MEFFIDGDGDVWRACNAPADESVWIHGFIRVRSAGRAVAVTLCPQLVQPPALMAAFLEIADLHPERTYVITRQGSTKLEGYADLRDAFRSIYDQMADEGTVRQPAETNTGGGAFLRIETAAATAGFSAATGR